MKIFSASIAPMVPLSVARQHGVIVGAAMRRYSSSSCGVRSSTSSAVRPLGSARPSLISASLLFTQAQALVSSSIVPRSR